ncbi:MAG TPA: FixG Ig-like domain-containing protein, partial [Rubrivivax sp.]|nr:FixG Ig-like domain-containing protein [Rubrivivax sp.]
VAVRGLPGIRIEGSDRVEVLPAEARWMTVAVRVPPDTAAAQPSGAHAIEFEVQRLDDQPDARPARAVEASTFVLPR